MKIGAVTELVHALEASGAVEQTTALLKSVMRNVALDDPQNLVLLLRAARQANAEETAEECIAVLLARDPAAHARLDDLSSVAELVRQLWLGQGREQAMSLASRTVAGASIDDLDGVCELVEILRRMGATEPLAALLARAPAEHVPLNDLMDLAKLLTSLFKAGAGEQVAALAARMSAVPVDRDNLEDLETLVDELWESGAKDQATAIAYRASTCAGPDDPETSVLVANMLVTVEAEEFEPALLDRCPVELADLTEVSAVFALLQALWESGAVEEVETLLARDPAMSVECDNSWDVARLLYLLSELRAEQVEPGAEQQIAILLARDLGTLVALDLPASVADLLKAMWNAGAVEQVKALARRAAEECGNLTTGPGSLLNALRDVGAEAEAATLVNRLPAEECFEGFLVEGDNKVVYQFGREPDGTPTDPWGWEDLNLSGRTRNSPTIVRARPYPLGRTPGNGKDADVYTWRLAAEPHATAERKRELFLEPPARQSRTRCFTLDAKSSSYGGFAVGIGQDVEELFRDVAVFGALADGHAQDSLDIFD